MAENVLVAGVGNIFCSDDGFGPAVATALLAGEIPAGARVVDYGIRGIHLAFDVAAGVDTLILVDTVPDAGGGPGSLAVREIDAPAAGPAGLDAHALDPGTVLRSLGALGDARPRTLLVGCQPAATGDGIGLSAPVAAAVPVAAAKVLQLLRRELGDPE